MCEDRLTAALQVRQHTIELVLLLPAEHILLDSWSLKF